VLAVNPARHYVSESASLTNEDKMSPELVDQAILTFCKAKFLKVARIGVNVAEALKVSVDPDGGFIADRIKALVKAERLDSQGNLDRWRFSEIRLPDPPQGANNGHQNELGT
jgi:hypothetical protein